jgi:molybdopterin/thiamine biosynthesis adenylyltransferase
MEYEELFKRNFPLVSREEQEKLKNLKIGIVGLGALSFVVEIARLGVQNFIFIDGDRVEAANVNHQRYTIDNIRKNKAQALAEYVVKINPQVKVIPLPVFLQLENFDEIWQYHLKDTQVIIDGIDPVPSLLVSQKLAQKSQEGKIDYFYPLDIGHGALLLTDPQLILELEGNDPIEMLRNLITAIISKIGITFPHRVQEILEKVIKGEVEHYPQTVISSLTASTLVISAIMQIIQGKKPPSLIYCDLTEGIFVSVP